MTSQSDSRKILEELNFKKQQLQKGLVVTQPIVPPALHEPATTSAARATLNQANTTSFGFFITTDSSFGNLILPVLPRFD